MAVRGAGANALSTSYGSVLRASIEGPAGGEPGGRVLGPAQAWETDGTGGEIHIHGTGSMSLAILQKIVALYAQGNGMIHANSSHIT